MSTNRPVIIDGVRTAVGKRSGALSDVHPARLLGQTVQALLDRNSLESSAVDQIIAGCVSQVGEQGSNIARNAWLSQGLAAHVGATTVDYQCGSSQQAAHLVAGLISTDAIDIGLAVGVEAMSRIPLGSNTASGPGSPRPAPFPWDLPASQFEAAERIANRWGLTRADVDAFAADSQAKAAAAWAQGHFDNEIVPISTPDGASFSVDEGLRSSTVASLGGLRTVTPNGIHTAGNSSQISDGSAALLLTSQAKAAELGLAPRARILAQVAVGSDPYYYLDGPIDATKAVLERSGLAMSDIDLFEVNEAFAAVPLSWTREMKPDLDRVNVSGGAIALGHPVGSTGARLLTTAVHALERTDSSLALVTMCCGGAMATATILERLA